jgi:uncharacterized protein YkwD/uncharacterized membrane protein required for colicin V production
LNLVDVALALVIVGGAYGGWRRGLLVSGADLVALALSAVFAFVAYPYLVMLAGRFRLEWGVWTAPLAFLSAYVVAHVLLEILVARFVKAFPNATHAHGVNRALGVIPGLVNGLVGAIVVSALLLSLPLADTITRAVGDSVLANRFMRPAEWLEARLHPIFDPALDRTVAKLTVTPGTNELVRLPYTVKAPKPRPDLEAGMLALVNVERQKHGLKPLQADAEVAEVARAHSRDMFARGYFSHISPQGEDPFARMRRGGVKFRAAGENLALARTLPMAHQGLMDSPGHRANILRPAFGRVGIGIVDGGRYGLMVTQNFRN